MVWVGLLCVADFEGMRFKNPAPEVLALSEIWVIFLGGINKITISKTSLY